MIKLDKESLPFETKEAIRGKAKEMLPEVSAAEPALAGRLTSLDVFRGLTIAAMVLVNNAGDWNAVYPPLLHAAWDGWTPTDLVFPFFVFVVGVAIPLALEKRKAAGGNQRDLYLKIFRRTLVIFLLGLMLNAFPFTLDKLTQLRIPGVLQRIAICYFFAALIFMKARMKTQVMIAAALLLGYWVVMKTIAAPGFGAGDLTMEGSLASWVDRTLLAGHTYKPLYDPEGLLSTIPAIATALFGVLAGQWLMERREALDKIAGLFAVGALCVIAGFVCDWVFPINKALWTSSYVMFTGGLALQLLALCYWAIDLKGYRRWAKPFVVFGVNALALYVLSSLMAKALSVINAPKLDGSTGDLKTFIYERMLATWLSPVNASLAFALGYVLLWWLLMWVLYRRKIFIKV
ncbi:MAG: acyltransferase family protein [Blastocatellia bacterium]